MTRLTFLNRAGGFDPNSNVAKLSELVLYSFYPATKSKDNQI